MSKKLNNKDFIEEGFGKPLIDFFKLLDEHIDKSTANIKELAGVLKKDISNNKLSTGADVQKLNEQKEQANALKRIQTEQKQAQKELSKIAEIEAKKQAKIEQDRRREIEKTVNFEKRERLKLANDLIKQRQKDEASRKRFAEKLRVEEQKQIARKKKLIEKNQAEQGSLKQLRQQLSLTTKAYDQLSKEERENTQVGKVLVKQIQKQQAEIRKLEEATGRAQRNVGNYKSAWSGVSGLFRSGMGILGVTGGITILSTAIRGGIETIKGYGTANSSLAGVLGKTRKETIELQAQQKLLGATTEFSATQVAKAQTDFARLGLSEQQLLDLTPAVLSVATALESELAPVAELVAGQLNAFGKSSKEGALVGDQLARVTQISALNFERLKVALPKVGTASSEMNVSFSETLATLGAVVDKNIEAEKAGTAFRNILLQSAKTGTDWRESLERIKNSTNKTGLATELFGKQNALVALTIANNTEKIKENATEIDNAGGTAEKFAKEQLNNLEGELKLLSSAWDGLILDIEGSEGALRSLVRTATDLIKVLIKNKETIATIAKVVGVAVTAWVAYKTTVIATSLATKAYAFATTASTFATKLFTGGIKKANFSFKALNTTMKANPIGLVVSAITIAITAFFAFRDEIDENTESLKKLKEEAGDAGATLQNRFDARLKLSTQQLKNLKAEIKESIATQQTALASETSIAVAQNKLIQDRIDFNKKEIESENERFNEFKSNFEENSVIVQQEEKDLKERIKILNDRIEAEEKNLVKVKDSTNETKKEKEQIKVLNELLKERNKLKKVDTKEGEESEKKGKLEEIDEKIKEARAKQRKATTEFEIKQQQFKIKQLERERRILLDIGETKKETAKQAEKDDKEEDKRREERGKEKLKQLEKEVQANEDAEKKKREFQDETIAKAFQAGEKLLDRLNDITNRNLDARIQASEKNQDRLTTLSASGNKEASKSLAQEADNQRKLEQERARTIRRQTAQAVILAGLELTIASARRGDEQPAQTASNQLSSNISNSESLAGNISNLAGFFTGTEKVSQDLAENKFYDGKDGYAVRVHGTERIIQGNDNQKLEGLSNAELVNAGVLYKKGGFDYHKYAGEVQSVNNVMINDNKEVVNKLDELKKTFINSQKSIDFSIDPINKHLIKETKQQGKTLRKHYKNGRLF